MSQRVPNSQGRISNLIRSTEADGQLINEYAKQHYSKKYEYYCASAQAFIDHFKSNADISFVQTPFNVSYKGITIYLTPHLYDQLNEIALSTGTQIGRVIATAMLHMARSHHH